MGIYEITTDGGTYQIETADPAPQIETADPAPESTVQDYAIGGLKGIGRGALDLFTAPADLLYRGGLSLMDALGGPSLSQEDILHGAPSARVKQFYDWVSGGKGNETAEDVGRVVSNLGLAFGVPSQGANIAKALPVIGGKDAGILAKVLGYGAEGAGYSVLADSDKSNPFENALTGGAISAALSAPFAVIEKIAPKLNEWGQAMKRKSLGATQGDYTRTADQIGAITESAELGTKTKRALDHILNDPSITNTYKPTQLLEATRAKEQTLASEIRGAVESFDKQIGTKVQPDFSRASSYIEKSVPADEVEKYRERLANFKDALKSQGDGSLTYLQDQKVALGKLWDPNDTTKNGFIRELYGDLQNTIEKHVPEVKGMNDELSNWLIGKNVFQKGVAKSEAVNLPELLRGAIRTSGGFGVPFLAASYAGNPLLGALLGAGGMYMTSPKGQRALGSGLQKLSKSSVPTQLAPLVAALVGAGGGSGVVDRESPQSPDLFDRSSSINMQPLEKSLPGDSMNTQALDYQWRNQLGQIKESSPYNNYRPQSDTTQGESSDMYNPVKWQGKEVPFESLVDAVGGWETRGLKGDKADNAVSPKGAAGFMQVMPATAKEVLVKLGEDPDSWNPKNREMSRRVGSFYLNELLDQFDGNIELALAAYNAGPGRVEQWIKRFGSRNWETIARNLKSAGSYDETVKYVPGVAKRLNQVIEV